MLINKKIAARIRLHINDALFGNNADRLSNYRAIKNAYSPLKLKRQDRKDVLKYLEQQPPHGADDYRIVTKNFITDDLIEHSEDPIINYDPILSDYDDHIEHSPQPCDRGSHKYDCTQTIDNTGKGATKGSKTNPNQFILIDSYMHDDDEPNNNNNVGKPKYPRKYENLIVTYSSYKRDGLRWRKDTKETFNLFRAPDREDIIVPADGGPLRDNSVLLRHSYKALQVDKVTSPTPEELYKEYLKTNPIPPRVDLEYEREMAIKSEITYQALQRRLKKDSEDADNLYKSLNRKFKKSNTEDFFRDPVASVVEVLEYISWYISDTLSLPRPDPVDHDKVIYKRDDPPTNLSIYIGAILKDKKVEFLYSRDLNNNSDGGEPIGYLFMNQ